MKGIEGKQEAFRRKNSLAKMAKQICRQCVKDNIRDCGIKSCEYYPTNPYATNQDQNQF